MWGSSNVALDRPVSAAEVPLVGRDALVDELLDRLDAGRSTLLLGAPDTGRSRLLEEIRARYGGATAFLRGTDAVELPELDDEAGPLLVLVDDLHRLRRRHVEVVARAVASSATVCVATALAGVRLPFTRSWPWSAGAWGVARLAPLDVRAVTEFATRMLGALPELGLVSELYTACGGQPRATRLLLERAVASGCVWFDGELWRLTGKLPTYDLGPGVERDLAGLSVRARHDAELLAFGAPMPIPVAAQLVTSEGQRELDQRGIAVVRDDREGLLELVQPVHAQALRDGVDERRREQILRQLAEAHDRDDLDEQALLRLARWRLESGGWSRGRWGDVAAVAWTAGHLDLARAAAARGSEAVAAGDDAVPSAASVASVASVASHETSASRSTSVAGAVALAAAAASTQRRGAELFAGLDRYEDPAAAVHRAPASAAWPFGGSLERGLRLLASGDPPLERYARAVAEQDEATADGRADAAWWAMVAGRCVMDAGRLDVARESLLRAARALASDDPVGLADEVALDLAHTAVLAGAPSEASAFLDQATSRGDGGGALRHALRTAIIHAWVIAHRYGPDAAAGRVIEVGDRAWDAGVPRIAVEAWHLAVRFGAPEAPAERFDTRRAEWFAEVGRGQAADDGRVREANRAADHAEALSAGDADRLHELAVGLAERGLALLAAEVAAQAAELGGERSDALASGLAASCPDAHTPALAGIAPAELTPSERFIASGVAAGEDPRSVARRAGISLRTVENHLSRVYRTLGVTGRDQLREVYRADAPLFAS